MKETEHSRTVLNTKPGEKQGVADDWQIFRDILEDSGYFTSLKSLTADLQLEEIKETEYSRTVLNTEPGEKQGVAYHD